MGHEIAVKIEVLSTKLEEVKKKYSNLKLKTTKNLHEGLGLKREMVSLETKIAIERSSYIKHLEILKKMKPYKQLWEE
ncbi:MAG: hypothetical protein ACRC0G_09705 [Fusobacteriaceae bacterium]